METKMTNPLIDDLIESRPYANVEIELPSRGAFYYEEDEIFESGFDPLKVQIRTMGIATDMAVKDPLMVLSRQATVMLIKSLVPEIRKPELLSEIDIVAIILGGRIATYGPQYRLEHVCQNPEHDGVDKDGKPVLKCEHARENTPNILDIDLYDHILRYAPYEDWSQFEVDFPEVNQKVFLRPTSYQQFLSRLKIDLEQNTMMDNYKDTEITEFITDPSMINFYKTVLTKSTETGVEQLVDAIFYVESLKKGVKVGDRDAIRSWVKAIPLPLVERLVQRVSKIREDIMNRAMIDYRCGSCGYENKVMLELDVERLFSTGSPETHEPNKIKIVAPIRETPVLETYPVAEAPPSEVPAVAPISEPSGGLSKPKRRNATPNSRIFSR